MKKSIRFPAMLLAALMMLGSIATAIPVFTASAADVRTWSGTNITHHEGGYDTVDRTLHTMTFDFSAPSFGTYAADSNFAYSGNPTLTDGHIMVKEGKPAAIGSGLFLAGEYGLEKGYASFDLTLTAGTVKLGARNAQKATDPDNRGIWFTIDSTGELTVTEKTSGLSARVPYSAYLAAGATFTLYEDLDALRLTCGDTLLVKVEYPDQNHLKVYDGAGTLVAETDESDVDAAGYFTLYMDDLEGYVDNMTYTHVSEEKKTSEEELPLRVIDYSTWTATDDLGRTVADNGTAGDPTDNRYVGLFYFLCWVGTGIHVYDNTKLYLDMGIDGFKEYLSSGRAGEAYWAEPYFGYYRNTDAWVYRKHAYMLEAAGVDFIFLDVSNAEVFIDGHMTLFDTWLQMRKEGIDTPQIVFFNGDTGSTFSSNMRTLYTTVYSDENWDTYKELFFLWEGKPLIFGNTSTMGYQDRQKLNEKFTVRGSWAWVDKDNYWPWLQEYLADQKGTTARMENGGWGRNADGKKESLSVALGHHATMSKGRSFVNRKEPNNGLGDFEFSSVEQAGKGLCFESQFTAAMRLIKKNIPAEDPFVLMITGWNEWIAGCFSDGPNQPFCNSTSSYRYVDNFNAEFSRDAEPMRNQDGYGFGDNYYYQMVDYIRQYKGISATPAADHQSTVDIYDLSTWEDIGLSYMDSLEDVEHRNTISYDADFRYINNTGRNDLEYAKVSQDDHNLYFLVKCANDIIIDDGGNWMNLYLNIDGDATNGWAGFDYLLNRDRDSFAVTVDRISGETMEIETVGGAYYAVQGQYMTIRLSKSLLGLSGKVESMTFKWADNSVDPSVEGIKDPMAFMDLGDAAPDNRFAYSYICTEYSTASEKPVILDKTAYTAEQSVVQTVEPGTSFNTSLLDKKVDMSFDMESERSGSFIANTNLAEYFQHVSGTSTSKAQLFKSAERGNYMRVTGYSDVRTWNDVAGAYEVSVDMHMANAEKSGLYIRGEMPGQLVVKNPANHGVDQDFNYYEWDWYLENGGHTFGGSSTAGSGIAIYPLASGIQITLKRYAPDGLTVASASYNFDSPAGYDINSWFNLHCVDDGETVTIYLNNEVLCRVLLEDPGLTYESDKTGQEYYGKATLTAPDGTALLTVENTRINSSGSQIALATRNCTMEFDDLTISYTETVVEGAHLTASFAATARETTVTPDDRLVTTLNLGSELPDETETEPASETEGETTSEPASETSSESASDESPATGETQAAKESGCGSTIGGGAILLTLTACGILINRKKEEKHE